MMLMLLLSELTRLQVHLSVESDGLHVQAPARVLTDELRQAMTEHKTDLLRFARSPHVETIDGPGMLTGNRRNFNIIEFVVPERQERLRYTIGVRLLNDGLERFYLPGTLWLTEQSGSK
jgi:TubC N-terminal docking domain